MSILSFFNNLFSSFSQPDKTPEIVNSELKNEVAVFQTVSKQNGLKDIADLFPKSAAQIELFASQTIKKCSEDLENFFVELEKGPKKTIDDALTSLDKIINLLSMQSTKIYVLTQVATDKDISLSAQQAVQKLMDFQIDLFVNKRMFNFYYELDQRLKNGEQAKDASKKLVEDSLNSLISSGCGLGEDEFKKFVELSKKLQVLEMEFSKNINRSCPKLECLASELTGVDSDFIDSLEKNSEGKVLVGVDYATIDKVMGYCTNQELRKNLYYLSANKAFPENEPVLRQIVNLRHELAVMLGYKDFASLYISSKMAKTPAVVNDFLDDIVQKLEEPLQKEFEKLTLELPEGIVLSAENKIYPWDFLFIKNEYNKKNFQLDAEKIAEYFPMESTIDGLLELYEKMLDIKFEKHFGVDGIWHEDVITLQAKNKGGDLIGIIFLDMYPRDGKYSHACMNQVIHPLKTEISEQIPVIYVLCNFQKPLAEKPSLLRHGEVVTFFHEFGHAMHGLIGYSEYSELSGTCVKRDFVETPSQMFEEWTWEPSVLKSLSGHYTTGEKLDDETIDRMIKNRVAFLASWAVRQIGFAFYSLRCFGADTSFSFKALEQEISLMLPSFVQYLPDTHTYANFGHLTGYAAGYYGYMWSLVFAKDVYSKIKEVGFDSKAAGEIVRMLLGSGANIDENILLEKVLGRKPSAKAFEAFLSI